ncbi:ISNCY family transposase, partial [Streptococcus pseudopneumoniae]|nr:ISNCY family transposase [Streptococcus pseudopneumoniae]
LHFCELLAEEEGIQLSDTTVRKILYEDTKKLHPSRPRKKFAGELIQMEASPHAWFGAETSNLHLAIDDASG